MIQTTRKKPLLAGMVLCGGESRRMGRPKAWLPLGGETLLGRSVRLVGEVAQPVVVVAAPRQELPPLPPGVLVARDEAKGRGPLEGMAAGMATLAATPAEAVYVTTCDAPFLVAAFVGRLLDLLGTEAICVPRVGEKYQPLSAIYRLSVLEQVRELLAAGDLRPWRLFEKCPTRVASEAELRDADPELLSLRNVNTPEEYALAVRQLQRGPGIPCPRGSAPLF